MSATDTEDGRTRLETAKEEIGRLIDRMKPNDSAMIISFSNTANVQQSYTRSRSLLKRKLDGIKQTNRSSEMSEALSAASGLANPGQTSDRESERDIQVADALKAKLYIFSDGGVKDVPNFSLGNLTPEYRPIGSSEIPHNVGITAFSISNDSEMGGSLQAFVRLQNSDDEDHTVTIELYVNGEIFDVRKDLKIPKEDARGLSFDFGQLLQTLESPVPVRIEIKDKDVYMLDNVVYGVIEPPRQANVLVITRYNKFLEIVMATDRIKKLANVEFQPPEFMKDNKYVEASTLGAYDLVIYDQCAPDNMPQCNTMFFSSVPPTGKWQVSEKKFPTVIVDTDAAHPLMNAVQMGTVTIVEGRALTGPKGTLSLIDAAYGSIMAVGPRSGFQDLVLGFSLIEYDDQGEGTVNSDWIKKLSFPLFMQNVVMTLGGGSKFNASQGTDPGALMKFRTRFPAQAAQVKSPDGETAKLLPRADNQFIFANTNETGIYEVTDLDTNLVDQLLSVNLLDTRESNLTVRDKLEIGFEEIQGTKDSVPARQEYWTWILLVVLVVLLFEWYIYNKRVFI